MAYEKTNWVDNETPINAANLNKMEEGIVEASKTGGILDGSIIEWEEEEIPEGYEEVEDDGGIDRKKIKKYSIVELPSAVGSISDTINVADKVKNAPSINLVQNMTGIPQNGVIYYDGEVVPEGYEEVESPYMTNLYSASSYVDTGALSESIDNFYGVLIIAKYDTHNTIGSEFIPSDLAKNTNIIVRAFNFNDPTTAVGGRLIIGDDGKALQFINLDGYIKAIYGVFRK